jgi:hypothetical protein
VVVLAPLPAAPVPIGVDIPLGEPLPIVLGAPAVLLTGAEPAVVFTLGVTVVGDFISSAPEQPANVSPASTHTNH